MPTVIRQNSCEGLSAARYGRITSGDSDWPTKMFDAAERLSILLIPVIHCSAPPSQNRDQRGEEDDHRQRRDREGIAADFGLGERAEQEIHPRAGVAEQRLHPVRRALQQRVAPWHVQHQRGEPGLERKGGEHHARADRAPIGRQRERDQQDKQHADQALDDMHGALPPGRAGFGER
jgi:hypothetical protein